MQKALIIQNLTTSNKNSNPLSSDDLNKYLADGWRFVSATPFGVAAAEGGETNAGSAYAAMLVIIEKA
jgi:hypothetical protein